MSARHPFRPDWRVAPGETILDCLIDRRMSRNQLGRKMKLPMSKVRPLFTGDAELTPDIAERLEQALGVPAQFWLNLEAQYRTPVETS